MPSSLPPLPPAPAVSENRAPRAAISPRKLILGFILACSVVCFFLILAVAVIALLREAAPKGHALGSPLWTIRHIIARGIRHLAHHH